MEPTLSSEDKKQYQLLQQLVQTEQFQVWRDVVALPVIEQLETDLANVDGLSEADLKAKVKHLNFVKHLFYKLFEQVDVVLENEE